MTDERADVLTVPSDPKHMRLIRRMVAGAVEVVGFQRCEVNAIALAVDEACTNVIRHAYGGDFTKRIDVRVEIHPDRIEVKVRDWGKKADPCQIKSRDLADVRPGGLGVHFIREIMDEVVYDTSVDVGTELRLKKLLTKG